MALGFFVSLTSANTRDTHQPDRWVPPSPGRFAINKDASLCSESSSIGIAVIILDNHNNMKVALSAHVTLPLSIRAAELSALTLGMEWAVDHGWWVSRVETDCKQEVDLVNSGGMVNAHDGVLVERVHHLPSPVGLSRLTFVSREYNRVVNIIAKHVSRRQGHHVWLGDEPL